MTELADLTATEMLAAFGRKELSPVAVTEAVLARIASWEPRLNATHALDPDGALAAARASEERWRRGAPAGVPVPDDRRTSTAPAACPDGRATLRCRAAREICAHRN